MKGHPSAEKASNPDMIGPIDAQEPFAIPENREQPYMRVTTVV